MKSRRWHLTNGDKKLPGTQLPFIEVCSAWCAVTLPSFTLHFWFHQTLRFQCWKSKRNPPWRKPHWFLPALMSMFWETSIKSVHFTPRSPFGLYKNLQWSISNFDLPQKCSPTKGFLIKSKAFMLILKCFWRSLQECLISVKYLRVDRGKTRHL